GALPAKRIAVASGLVMDFVTICDRPWYGLMCSRYCTEHNDAHYICDPRGEKVCLAGWTGKDCDTVTEDVFLAPFDDGTQAPPTTVPSTVETTFTFTGTKIMETASTTAAAPATSFAVTSTRKKLRVQK
ncbi:delta serrate ligand, partial [Oesophagostomum dentatum]